MTRRFSAQQLSYLRNKVAIDRVIKTFLCLPTCSRTGKLSFACPVCHGFNTSINAQHNLARCFDCRQNFNPIELVMHQLKISFVDSVKWLQQNNRKPVAEEHTATHPRNAARPVAIGDILSEMLPARPAENTANLSLEIITQRIWKLEQSVKQLYRLLEKLQTSVYQR
jgi:hypothetical protein